MTDERMPNDLTGDAPDDGERGEPFRRSGSGEEYEPAANWAAERRLDHPTGGVPHGMEGAPSGAGDGGYGPEGNYAGPAGERNADVLGQVGGDRDPLVEEARELGAPRPGRAFPRSDARSVERGTERDVVRDAEEERDGGGRRDA